MILWFFYLCTLDSLLFQAVICHRQTAPAEGNRCPVRNTKAHLIQGTTVWRSISHLKGWQRQIKSSFRAQEARRRQPGWQLAHPRCTRTGRWNFNQGYERKLSLLPRVTKSVTVNREKKRGLCLFFNPLIEFPLFLAYKIHRNKREHPGTS